MGIKEKILKSMGFFLANLREKTLQTLEEVEANTNNGYWAGAGAVSELNNKLAGQPEWVKDATGKITGYKTNVGGADTVFPFRSGVHYVMTTYSSSPDHIVMVDKDGKILKYNAHHNSTAYTVEYEHFQYYRGNCSNNIIREPSRITAKVRLKYAQCIGLGIPSPELSVLEPGSRLELYHSGDYVSTIIWPE